jgi:hypothetical protein
MGSSRDRVAGNHVGSPFVLVFRELFSTIHFLVFSVPSIAEERRQKVRAVGIDGVSRACRAVCAELSHEVEPRLRRSLSEMCTGKEEAIAEDAIGLGRAG